MGSSVDYVKYKSVAVNNLKNALKASEVNILSICKINRGLGMKICGVCGKEKCKLVIYSRKNGYSSKIVFEDMSSTLQSRILTKLKVNWKEDDYDRKKIWVR